MNTVTKNWGQFKGWNANCWSLYLDDAYFGGADFVGRAWNGNDDASANISTSVVQAFNYFGSPGKTKRWTMMRPIFNTNGTPTALMGLNIDFNINDPTGTVSFTSPGYATWDSGVWDTATWGGGVTISQQWVGVNGMGKCAGATILTDTAGIELHWVATDYVYEQGWTL